MVKESKIGNVYTLKKMGVKTTRICFYDTVCCLHCRYCRHKRGLSGEEGAYKRYEFFTCMLTYEPLPREKVGNSIGEHCPLTFSDPVDGEDYNFSDYI